MEQIILRNTQSPGDYIVMSAAIRDIHRAYPGRYKIGVDVPQRAIFQGNPHVDLSLRAGGRKIVAKYPLIKQCNQNRLHFLWGFIQYMNSQLNINAVLTELRPDLHLTEEEKVNPPLGAIKPYWVVVSGGKRDFTAKWWHPVYWQRVADVLSKRFELVQVGGGSHVHPILSGTRNLVGKTSFRELMRLIYHADGVLCIVTCLMHIAAAFNKPCVVVAGGREPWWWEGYTQENRLVNLRAGIPDWKPPEKDNYVEHRYLHTLNQLSCCVNKGCWKTKIEKRKGSCVLPVNAEGVRLPRCMEIITPDHVLAAVDSYYNKKPFSNLIEAPQGVAPPPPPADNVPPAIVAAVRQRAALPIQPAAKPKPEPEAPPVPPRGLRTYLYLGDATGTATYLKLFQERWLESQELVVLSQYTTPDIESWCQETKASLVKGETRPELMHRVLHGNEQQWTAWLEYPWLPKGKAIWSQLLRKGGNGRCAMGLVYWRRLTNDMIKVFTRAAWYRKADYTPMTLLHGAYRVFYPGPGFWLMPTDFLRDIKFDQWPKDDLIDVTLGEALHQQAVPLHEVGTLMLRA